MVERPDRDDRAFVVKGLYPEDLLEQWDTFSETYGTESVRPGKTDQVGFECSR